jgi:hypothetical protein
VKKKSNVVVDKKDGKERWMKNRRTVLPIMHYFYKIFSSTFQGIENSFSKPYPTYTLYPRQLKTKGLTEL